MMPPEVRAKRAENLAAEAQAGTEALFQAKRRRERGDRSSEWFGLICRYLTRYVEVVAERNRGLDALEELAMMRTILDDRTADVVASLRSEAGGAYSWQSIADALDLSRQATMKRYGGADLPSPRKRGAQLGHLR